MEKVKVVYMNGKESLYDVDYPKAYIAKIMERENALMLDQKSVKEIYRSGELVAVFAAGFSNELVLKVFSKRLEKTPKHDAYVDRQKPTAGMGRYKGHTVPSGCDVGQYLTSEVLDIKDKIKADEDWNAYQEEIVHAQEMLEENAWVMDHTCGNVKINYIPRSL